MDNSSLAYKIARSLSFEVEAIPQDNIIQFTNRGNMTPLNVKIRVRKKDDGTSVVRKGMITIPRADQPDMKPERVRLASSDQTIMSFNMLMEADLEKKPNPKPKKNFFGMCLGMQVDDDDSQYQPSKADKDINSHSDSVMFKQNTVLIKNIEVTSPTSSHRKKDRKFFGKCKPGGCLDPPFGEDKYSYKPKETKETAKERNKVQNKQFEKVGHDGKVIDKIETNKTSKNNKQNDSVSTAKVVHKEDTKCSSILSLYQGDPNHTLEENDSDSIITYPPALSSSRINFEEDKINKSGAKRNSVPRQSRKSFNEFNTTYFSPPKTPRESRESKDSYRGDKRKNSPDPINLENAVFNSEAEKDKSAKSLSPKYLRSTETKQPTNKKEVEIEDEMKQRTSNLKRGKRNSSNKDTGQIPNFISDSGKAVGLFLPSLHGVSPDIIENGKKRILDKGGTGEMNTTGYHQQPPKQQKETLGEPVISSYQNIYVSPLDKTKQIDSMSQPSDVTTSEKNNTDNIDDITKLYYQHDSPQKNTTMSDKTQQTNDIKPIARTFTPDIFKDYITPVIQNQYDLPNDKIKTPGQKQVKSALRSSFQEKGKDVPDVFKGSITQRDQNQYYLPNNNTKTPDKIQDRNVQRSSSLGTGLFTLEAFKDYITPSSQNQNDLPLYKIKTPEKIQDKNTPEYSSQEAGLITLDDFRDYTTPASQNQYDLPLDEIKPPKTIQDKNTPKYSSQEAGLITLDAFKDYITPTSQNRYDLPLDEINPPKKIQDKNTPKSSFQEAGLITLDTSKDCITPASQNQYDLPHDEIKTPQKIQDKNTPKSNSQEAGLQMLDAFKGFITPASQNQYDLPVNEIKTPQKIRDKNTTKSNSQEAGLITLDTSKDHFTPASQNHLPLNEIKAPQKIQDKNTPKSNSQEAGLLKPNAFKDYNAPLSQNQYDIQDKKALRSTSREESPESFEDFFTPNYQNQNNSPGDKINSLDKSQEQRNQRSLARATDPNSLKNNKQSNDLDNSYILNEDKNNVDGENLSTERRLTFEKRNQTVKELFGSSFEENRKVSKEIFEPRQNTLGNIKPNTESSLDIDQDKKAKSLQSEDNGSLNEKSSIVKDSSGTQEDQQILSNRHDTKEGSNDIDQSFRIQDDQQARRFRNETNQGSYSNESGIKNDDDQQTRRFRNGTNQGSYSNESGIKNDDDQQTRRFRNGTNQGSYSNESGIKNDDDQQTRRFRNGTNQGSYSNESGIKNDDDQQARRFRNETNQGSYSSESGIKNDDDQQARRFRNETNEGSYSNESDIKKDDDQQARRFRNETNQGSYSNESGIKNDDDQQTRRFRNETNEGSYSNESDIKKDDDQQARRFRNGTNQGSYSNESGIKIDDDQQARRFRNGSNEGSYLHESGIRKDSLFGIPANQQAVQSYSDENSPTTNDLLSETHVNRRTSHPVTGTAVGSNSDDKSFQNGNIFEPLDSQQELRKQSDAANDLEKQSQSKMDADSLLRRTDHSTIAFNAHQTTNTKTLEDNEQRSLLENIGTGGNMALTDVGDTTQYTMDDSENNSRSWANIDTRLSSSDRTEDSRSQSYVKSFDRNSINRSRRSTSLGGSVMSKDSSRKDKRDEEYDPLLRSSLNQSFQGIYSAKDSIKSKDSVFLNLAFQTYMNKQQLVVKTLDSSKELEENKVTLVRGEIKPQDNGVLIPIDSAHIMHVEVQSALTSEVDRKFKSLKSSANSVPSEFSNISKVSFQDIESGMHATVSSLFDQELVPLQQLIKNLKDDIDALAAQQMLLKERLGQGPKRLRPIRASLNMASKRCCCLRRY